MQKVVHITETRCGTCKHLKPLPVFKYDSVCTHPKRKHNGPSMYEPDFFAEHCALWEKKK